MNRIIKFRAWNIDQKEFIYLNLSEDENDIFGRHGLLQNGNYEAWQQFTGLKDKKGNEICEGDILKFPNHIPHEDDEIEVVEYSDEDANFNPFYYCSQCQNSNCEAETSEIIGNIYENPDLLK